MRLNIAILLPALLLTSGCGDNGAAQRARLEQAQSQVRRITEKLDQQTTETGVYIRAKDGEIQERDPWGTLIEIGYSQGGVAEVVTVRSAGPDREFQTKDDVVSSAEAVNLKGIGEGIKKHTEEAAASAAKGAVKGAIDGVKESIKDSFKKKPADAKTDDEPVKNE